jgi:hypothetical protein
VDVDISDERCGARRVELEAQSRARREAEAAERKRVNAELQARLKAVKARTDDGDGLEGGSTPFASPGRVSGASPATGPLAQRASDVHIATFLKFEAMVRAHSLRAGTLTLSHTLTQTRAMVTLAPPAPRLWPTPDV